MSENVTQSKSHVDQSVADKPSNAAIREALLRLRHQAKDLPQVDAVAIVRAIRDGEAQPK